MKKNYVSGGLLVLLSAAAVLTYQSATAKRDAGAILLSVKGTVSVKLAGSADWAAAREKMTLNEGDTLRSQAGSSAIIKFADDSMTKLGPMALMTITSLSASDSGQKTGLGIDVGKTWSRVQKLRGDESAFSVLTPTAIAGVRGTYFSSEVEEDTTSNFSVFEGLVSVSSLTDTSQSVNVEAHHATTVEASKSPTTPAKMTAEEESDSASGFSKEEYTSAKFSVQVSVNPQVLSPGEKATVSIQVFMDNEPFRKSVSISLALSGSALFVSNGNASIETVTDSNGSLVLEITDKIQETVNVTATLKIKVSG